MSIEDEKTEAFRTWCDDRDKRVWEIAEFLDFKCENIGDDIMAGKVYPAEYMFFLIDTYEKETGRTALRSSSYEDDNDLYHAICAVGKPVPRFGAKFDGYEVWPCHKVDELDGVDVIETCESEEAEFWSVYGHETGAGLHCLIDVGTEAQANAIAEMLTRLDAPK